VRSGAIVHQEDVQRGLENAPRTLLRLFTGANTGKQILQVAEPGAR
jgi:NADPH-dependent curcumin reductase CurA